MAQNLKTPLRRLHSFSEDMLRAGSHGTVKYNLELQFPNNGALYSVPDLEHVCFSSVFQKNGEAFRCMEDPDELGQISKMYYQPHMYCHPYTVKPYYDSLLKVPVVDYLITNKYIEFDFRTGLLTIDKYAPMDITPTVMSLFRKPAEFGTLADAVIVLNELYDIPFVEALWLVNNWEVERAPGSYLGVGETIGNWNTNHLSLQGAEFQECMEAMNMSFREIRERVTHKRIFGEHKPLSPMSSIFGVHDWWELPDSTVEAVSEEFEVPLNHFDAEAYDQLQEYMTIMRG